MQKVTSEETGSPWSMFHVSEQMMVLDALSTHCHTMEDLQSSNYIVKGYDKRDYVDAGKCKHCNVAQLKAEPEKPCQFHPFKRNKWNVNKPYKCCWLTGTEPGAQGCRTSATHDFQPTFRSIRHRDFQQTPSPSGQLKCRAVVLDCEMAGVVGGGPGEPILLCVADYATGAVILNRYIYPRKTINAMRSSVHGISKKTLSDALAQGEVLDGWQGARSELWKYIDADTILVGHALENDLDALRIIHHRVVDSAILSRKEVGGGRFWGLQALCSELVNLDIRKNKHGIHDCLEDVLATREVVLCCTRNKEIFRIWTEGKKIEQRRLMKKREEELKKKREEKLKIQDQQKETERKEKQARNIKYSK
ncbi:hypothetical protein DSL72_007500 [Monilinia vaccinii-corymbosi]|uniref:Exonuclease domain-containing protein n=1 Tax=Monilinia vaccinii-corymbosi TaxID=61207 RepID=A0A8A3PI53_9HELO|nr:hypothetical protein DSL72_007500 [Monilinia vaccinii-corymbosi]